MAKHKELKNHMEALRRAVPELNGLLLASSEGLPIAYSLSNGTDPNRVAAMAGAVSSLGRRISDNMNVGTLGDVSISAEKGAVFFYSAGSRAMLVVLGPHGCNVGLIHLEARITAIEMGNLFS
jgi:predicted regulator of Ras-like GTPase activity (Roadblock/LC7/MglB family)